MAKRKAFCGWCGEDILTGHANDCPKVAEGRIVWEHEPEPELQPCGHPIQAIRSTPYIGDQHSNYCGWCADVEHEHELSQALTVELLAYREKVARLREAIEKLEWVGFM